MYIKAVWQQNVFRSVILCGWSGAPRARRRERSYARVTEPRTAYILLYVFDIVIVVYTL